MVRIELSEKHFAAHLYIAAPLVESGILKKLLKNLCVFCMN